MAGRSAYTEEDRAKVYAVLLTNDGNVKRTARDTLIPEQTVRRWKGEFATSPPATELITEVAEGIKGDMDRVRRLALTKMESLIRDDKAKLGELNTVFGTLTDKMNILDGLATSRVDHTHSLPKAEDIRDVLLSAITEGITNAAQRQDDVIEADVIDEREVRALNA